MSPMFFNRHEKRALKQQIKQLEDSLSYRGVDEAHSFTLDINKKFFVKSKRPRNKHLSFRDYLLDLVDADYKKANAIYNLIQAQSENLKDALYKKLGEQRAYGWFKSEKTVGQQLFDQACLPPINLQIADEKYSVKLPDPDPVHEIPLFYSPSTQIENDNLLHAVKLFDDIPPEQYRRGIYVSSRQVRGVITLDFPEDISEHSLPEMIEKNSTVASTRQVLKLPLRGKANKWIPLTTLTMNDRVSDFIAKFPHKFGYSHSAKQYYVMPLIAVENDMYEVSYKLHVGKKSSIEYNGDAQFDAVEQNCLSCLRDFQFNDSEKELTLKSHFSALSLEKKLIILQTFFHEFAKENLTQPYEAPTMPALNLMLKEKKGVCAQRAVICREIAKIIGLNLTHTIINDIHAFSELENYHVDLGGGNVKVLVYNPDLTVYLQLFCTTILTAPNFSIPPLAAISLQASFTLNPSELFKTYDGLTRIFHHGAS